MRGLLPKGPDNKFVWMLVRKTDLPFGAVRALLIRGWTYEESTESAPIWMSPSAKLRQERV